MEEAHKNELVRVRVAEGVKDAAKRVYRANHADSPLWLVSHLNDLIVRQKPSLHPATKIVQAALVDIDDECALLVDFKLLDRVLISGDHAAA